MEKKTKVVKSKKTNKRSASFSLLEVIVIVIMTALVVGVSSSLIVYKNYNKINSDYNNDNKDFKFKISVDGGVNNIVAKKIYNLTDIIVSGNYITSSIDFQKQINSLRIKS